MQWLLIYRNIEPFAPNGSFLLIYNLSYVLAYKCTMQDLLTCPDCPSLHINLYSEMQYNSNSQINGRKLKRKSHIAVLPFSQFCKLPVSPAPHSAKLYSCRIYCNDSFDCIHRPCNPPTQATQKQVTKGYIMIYKYY